MTFRAFWAHAVAWGLLACGAVSCGGDPSNAPDEKTAVAQSAAERLICSNDLDCDGGDPCTIDSCLNGACVHSQKPDGSACSDGNQCTTGDACSQGICTGTAVALDDQNPCTIDTCDSTTGIAHVPMAEGTYCDLGSPCMNAGSCDAGGHCYALPKASGTSCSDGNSCNGAETCDGFGNCSSGSGGSSGFSSGVMVPQAPLPTGCDDGNPCTISDTCVDSACVPGSYAPAGTSCPDSPCMTARTCDGNGTCQGGTPKSAGSSCSDGNSCNGTETCDSAGNCQSGTPLVGSDGQRCTLDICDPATGTFSHPVASAGTPCSDGNECNGTETCDAQQQCVAGTPPVVDDGDPCTLDACDPLNGVIHATCSPIDGTVATTVDQSTSFIHAGPTPLQTGLDPNVLDPARVAIIRGKVRNDVGVFMGATISILGHPEFGKTVSQANGDFDLAVNGGAPLTVSIEGVGYLPMRRRAEPRWQEYTVLPEVVLTAADAPIAVTLGDVNGAVAQATQVSDTDGTRRATLMFQPETHASQNGGSLGSSLNVRATEYTRGVDGPKRMPAFLPPSSGYTYAVEYGFDEAVDGSTISFDKPVFAYVDNFLDMPVGTPVPAGYYDKDKDAWVASEAGDGLVIKVLSVDGGVATVDSDGNGVADTALNMSPWEIAQLATLYTAGKTLWRVPITHFSSWDFNWPFGPPADALAALDALNELLRTEDSDGSCKTSGSIIECENQILGESFPVSGTPFSLNYWSDRVPGRKAAYRLKVRVLPVPKPTSLKRIDVELEVAGRVLTQSFDCNGSPGCDASTTAILDWDGKDAYGRTLQGRQPVELRIGYVYPGAYQAPVPNGFGQPGSGTTITGVLTRQEVTIWSSWRSTLGTFRSVEEKLGGFSFDVHHRYDPVGKTVYLGNGDRQSATGLGQVISTYAGGCSINLKNPYDCDGVHALGVNLPAINGIVVAADGSVYISETSNHRVRRITPDGFITTLAGTGTSGNVDGSVSLAQLNAPEGLALAPDGSLYIADTGNNTIRRLKDGQLQTVAGSGNQYIYSVADEGLDAKTVSLWSPRGVAVGADGAIFIADTVHNLVRRVDPAGRIYRYAGLASGAGGTSGDGGPAMSAAVGNPVAVAVGKDGSVFVSQYNENRVRRIQADGTIQTLAGNGTGAFDGDGSPAVNAQIHFPLGLAVGADGSVFIADHGNNRVRRVGADGIIQTVAGKGAPSFSDGDGGPATAAGLNDPRSVALAPDGTLYSADNSHVRRISTAIPGYTGVGDIVIPSRDGSLLYTFSPAGKHQSTRDAYTGATLLSFNYSGGFLSGIVDSDGNTTQILRSAGEPYDIVGPFGRHSPLTTYTSGTPTGYLHTLANSANETVTFSYGSGGLMTGLDDPKSQHHTFAYDAEGLGRLELDQDPAGGWKSLSRSEITGAKTFSVDVTTALSSTSTHTTTHKLEILSDGSEQRTVTGPDGLPVVTLSKPDGTSTTTYVDGTTVNRKSIGDPRFGVQVPIGSLMSIVTDNKSLGLIMARQATLSDKSNPLSLITLEDSISVNGKIFKRTYHAGARQFVNETPLGRQTYTWLDAKGRVSAFQVMGLSVRTILHYDAQGRLDDIKQEDQDHIEPTREMAFIYRSADGELDHIENPPGSTIASFNYDSAGRTTTVTELNGWSGTRTTSYGYDFNGNLDTLTPPGKPQHTFSYTPVDLVSAYIPPGVAGVMDPTTSITPTLDKRPLYVDFPVGSSSGDSIDATYEPTTGRLATVTATTSGPSYALSLNYTPSTDPDANKRGKLESIFGPTAGTEIHFSYAGMLETGVTEKGILPGGADITLARTFDTNLRVDSVDVNGSSYISFVYDNDGLLSNAGALAITHSSDNGLILGTTLQGAGHNVNDSLTYTPFGEPKLYSAWYDTNSGNPLFTIDHQLYDYRGLLYKKVETINGVQETISYNYDNAGRLATYTRKDQNALVITSRSYAYDANGNRTSIGSEVWGTADAQDRLPSSPNVTYTYAANGELKTRTDGSGTTTFTYDVFGNLRTVARPAPLTPITYGVDGLNRRVSKSVNGVLQRVWAYDGARIVAEFDGTGAMLSRFVYGTRPNVPDYMLKGGELYRILSDHLGSVRLVVKVSDGSIVEQIKYDPWGAIESPTPPSFQPFAFAGGLYDPDTQLLRFGARDYDPATGRWTAKDPSGFAGGDNLYVYADDDPVNRLDLTGKNPILAAAAFGAIVGAGEDLFFQMAIGGKSWDCVDKAELLASALLGAVSEGMGAVGGAAAAAGRICFAAGTLVLAEDGLVPIEEIKVGDLVWSRDDKTGEEGWRAVTELFETPNQELLELQLAVDDGGVENLRVTPGHPFWSLDDDRWDSAADLDIGERVETLRGPMRLIAVTKERRRETVYNFDVEGLHTYFVGEAGVWAHNWCPGASLRGKSLKAIQRAKPKGWRTFRVDRGSGWKWVDQNGVERLRYMRPNGKNPSASQWSRQSNGYFRWKNEAGDFLDIDGNVVPLNHPQFNELTHIMYEGL